MAEQRTRTRITDPKVMRALAHPARIAIVEHLQSTGDAVSATQCAGLVELSPSATSYHLRELAKVGLVEEAPSRGDGRERLWRSTTAGLSVDADLDEPEARRSQVELVDVYLTRDFARLRGWVAHQHEEPKEWRAAAELMMPMLLVTAEELTVLNERVRELMEPYRRRDRIGDAPEGARPVAVHYASFPIE